jgi:hypothetical protein
MTEIIKTLKKGDVWFNFVLAKYGIDAAGIGYIECIIEKCKDESFNIFPDDDDYYYDLTWRFYSSIEKAEIIAQSSDIEGNMPEYWGRPQDFHLGNRKVSSLVEKGLTYPQARRYAMSESGMTMFEIAEAEGIGIPSVQDSIEAARKKLT